LVSPYLRYPLSAIGAGASMLRRLTGVDDTAIGRAVDLVARNVVRMQQLVGNLLDLARHDSAGLRLDMGKHPPRAIVYDALDTLAPVAAQKNVQLEARMPAELPVVRCDREAMVRVLTNIISNAVKFTPSGGAIRVRVERARGDIRIAVSDTGPGIARSEMVHVFDRFWQAKRASRTGAGLGLSIAKAIVEETGGSIGVESHVGVGTTFYFTIPLA
jgi:signal transduction histidine kinase